MCVLHENNVQKENGSVTNTPAVFNPRRHTNSLCLIYNYIPINAGNPSQLHSDAYLFHVNKNRTAEEPHVDRTADKTFVNVRLRKGASGRAARDSAQPFRPVSAAAKTAMN